MHLPDPTFPPMFKGHAVKAPLTALDEACRRAATGELSAGDLVWSRNTARAECALILEPEVSLARACQMAALGYVALVETLGAIGPPQMPVEWRWPGTVLIDGAPCGAVGLSAPACAADTVPPWLVLSVTLTLTLGNEKQEPGLMDRTALDLEGAGDVTRSMVIEALATRLLAWLHTWGESGFRQIHDQWLLHAEGHKADVSIGDVTGRVVGMDEDGNQMLKTTDGRVVSRAYLPHVQVYAGGA
jgi:BirA family transcriptional regulator, biotin operon repressor / biotin---[acetyl-CoA-carboxylase] ligase